ncbi:MAG: hypothetical protein JWM33_997 [Caulobacteraceae bacterium]|nr:hypothetical protein [Caulobacteraceae bacterium]
MPAGTLRWFDPEHGRGSIALDSEREVFVALGVEERPKSYSLSAGQRVTFELSHHQGLGREVATALRLSGPRRAAIPRPAER